MEMIESVTAEVKAEDHHVVSKGCNITGSVGRNVVAHFQGVIMGRRRLR